MAADKGYLDCNLGQDVFDPVDEYTLNFRSMSMELGRVRREDGDPAPAAPPR